MNFLAHAHLSFNHPQIIVGNIISDFVKGKKQFDYSVQIANGIQLHRAIDNFTDTHVATKEIKLFFKPQYGLYAGAFVDVVYDYFLANDTTQFLTNNDLKLFANFVYTTLQQNIEVLPDTFKKMLPYMVKQNWLCNYKFKTGIKKSFGGLVGRAKYLTESEIAFKIFNNNQSDMKHLYNTFYTELKNFAAAYLQQLLNQ